MKSRRLAEQLQFDNWDIQSLHLIGDWSDSVARRLRESLLRLSSWRLPLASGQEDGIDSVDSYLWAEGPLPHKLVSCINCDASVRERPGEPCSRTSREPRRNRQRLFVLYRGNRSLH